MGSVIIPFIKMENGYDDFKEFVDKMWDWWDENGKNRERIGELIQRQGLVPSSRPATLIPFRRWSRSPAPTPTSSTKKTRCRAASSAISRITARSTLARAI
jgi:sulfite reductase alpha subunit